MFGGGAKGKITGRACLSVDGLPELEHVLLVDGLTVNLIRISQLCKRGMKQLISKKVVNGLPKNEIKEKVYGECQVGKQTKVSQQVVTTRVLEVLHMDLMGPMQVQSIGGKKYIYVCVDNFSRYTWMKFIREKSDAFDAFQQLATQTRREKGITIIRIMSDHDKEFENSNFNELCSSKVIKHEFSTPITPQ
ncbi:hypothetical protein LIER_38131 [Lithospermum erythrorhizon]|uniref:Integrase catalytic domain-containing protein n=1 Tax=Lithospermum erythrorhizon TaxID=34254 RepID=A0AAV3PX49_LITER